MITSSAISFSSLQPNAFYALLVHRLRSFLERLWLGVRGIGRLGSLLAHLHLVGAFVATAFRGAIKLRGWASEFLAGNTEMMRRDARIADTAADGAPRHRLDVVCHHPLMMPVKKARCFPVLWQYLVFEWFDFLHRLRTAGRVSRQSAQDVFRPLFDYAELLCCFAKKGDVSKGYTLHSQWVHNSLAIHVEIGRPLRARRSHTVVCAVVVAGNYHPATARALNHLRHGSFIS